MSAFDILADDRLIADQLLDFLPDQIYDMHMHVYRSKDLNVDNDSLVEGGPDLVGIDRVRHFYHQLFKSRELAGGLAIGYPTPNGDRGAVNVFVAEQVADEKRFFGSICISPDDAPDHIRDFINCHKRIGGMKPYHSYNSKMPTWDLPIPAFLPEWAWQIAHENGLAITLHLVRDDAIADPRNQEDIRLMAEKYPNARLILAHAARCFHAPNAKKGLPALQGLNNIWFDMSAICEPEPIREILVRFGPRRLFWGSDFPVCTIRGRAVTLGLDFIWLQEDTINWENLKTRCRPVLVALESLRALKTACDDLGLNRSDIRAIFHDNARSFLGV